jgi:hypothetical protein
VLGSCHSANVFHYTLPRSKRTAILWPSTPHSHWLACLVPTMEAEDNITQSAVQQRLGVQVALALHVSRRKSLLDSRAAVQGNARVRSRHGNIRSEIGICRLRTLGRTVSANAQCAGQHIPQASAHACMTRAKGQHKQALSLIVTRRAHMVWSGLARRGCHGHCRGHSGGCY